MGIKIAGIDVSGIVAKEIGGKVLNAEERNAVLHHVVAGVRTGNLTGGTNPTETDHTCKGFFDTKNQRSVKGTLVQDGSEVVVLIGDTISPAVVPVPEDRVTLEGATYYIKAVDADPALATYTLLVRAV